MAKPMTASDENGMTDGQIDDMADKFRAALRKHRVDIPSDVAQQVAGIPNLGMKLFEVIRELVEAMTGLVVRLVENIDRTRSPQQVIDETERKQYVDSDVVAAMPRGDGDTAKLTFFKPAKSAYKNGVLSCTALQREYEKRGLEPDAEALADYNKKNPEAADKEPNACQWIDAQGNFCGAAFGRWGGERRVDVDRGGGGWRDRWSFAGVPKESSASAV